jgi:hypothetical protein
MLGAANFYGSWCCLGLTRFGRQFLYAIAGTLWVSA